MKVNLLESSLCKVFLTKLRDKSASLNDFRAATNSLTALLIAEASKHLPTTSRRILTPLEETEGFFVDDVVLLPILRAGLGMLESALLLHPTASVGMIGVQRNETNAVATKYYSNMPSLLNKHVFILEPMLATGGTSSIVIEEIESNAPAAIYFISIVAAPEGIEALSRFKGVEIFVAGVDRELNSKKYILPGLGDFGDRLFGTN